MENKITQWVTRLLISAMAISSFAFMSNVSFAAVPTLSSAVYTDGDSNGRVDTIVLTFNQTIATCTATVADFALVANDLTGAALAGGSVSCTGADAAVTIDLGTDGPALTTSHTTAPTIAYTDDAGREISNAGAEQAASFGAGNISDGAAPVYVSSAYKDLNANGTVDTVDVTLSEVPVLDEWDDADWTVSTAGSITLANETAAAVSGSGIRLTVSADANETGGATSPQFTYTANGGTANSVHDAAGNNTGNIAASSISDSAQPILLSATFGNTSNKNTLAVIYSEAMYVDLTGDGTLDGTDIYTGGAGLTTASTANYGTIDAAGSIKEIGNFSTAGTVTQNAATTNLLTLSNSDKTITITFNNTTGSFFTNSTTVPSGNLTPDEALIGAGLDKSYILAQQGTSQAIKRAESTPLALISGTTPENWELTSPTQITQFRVTNIGGAGTSAVLAWQSHSTLADFSRYMIAYGTSSGVSLSSSLWTSSNDATLGTITTSQTDLTGLTNGTTYYAKAYAIDVEGNVSTASSEYEFRIIGATTGSKDTTAPSVPTSLKATVNSTNGVDLTWADPSNSDLNYIQVVRSKGKDVAPVSVYTTVAKGIQKYTDTDVKEGEVVNYKIKAYDTSGNASVYTDDISLTVKAGASVETTVKTTTETTTTTEEDTAVEEDAEVTTTTDSTVAVELKDIATHWATDEITALVEMEIVKGNPDGSFKPDNALNRAEAATLLFRVLGMDEEEMSAPEDKPFSDVAVDAWYAIYVDTLKGLEVIKGNPDGTYAPGKNINRAEFLTLAMNAYYYMMAEEMGEVTVTGEFSDLDKSAWYAKTVSKAFEMKFVSGSACGEKKCFNAGSNITRAEATVMLYNIFYKEVSVDDTMPAEDDEDTDETEVN